MNNQYGLDADYFIRLCAREFNPDVIRNQNPEDLARAFARAARTACAEVLAEAEFAAQAGVPETLNEWFISLPDGRQAVLREDKWALADAAYEAGKRAAAPAAPAPAAQEPEWGYAKTIGNLIAQLGTLDPGTPIYATLRLDDGRVALKGLTLSKEWKTGRFIQPWKLTAERVAVLWTQPDCRTAAEQPDTKAARDLLAERRRQVDAEGWAPAHDDEHSDGQMARAASCYALAGSCEPPDEMAGIFVDLAWPWTPQWWKPTTSRRNLVKAGALILAEIERLDRAMLAGGEA